MDEPTEKTTTITVRADDAYKAAVRELARRKGKPIGDLVREALDIAFGTEVSVLVSFFATGLNSGDNSYNTKTNQKVKKSGRKTAKVETVVTS